MSQTISTPVLDESLLPHYTTWVSTNGEGYGLWDYLEHNSNYDMASAFSKLFWPDFVEFEGCVFLAEAYRKWSQPVEDQRREARKDPRSIEKLVNHLHMYDLFWTNTTVLVEDPEGGPRIGVDQVYSLQLKEYLAQVLLVCWKHALQEKYPEREFEFSYATEPDEYGPTITFWQKE